ncbi:M56 family metallopeptidase [Silvibacterium sp.]|uniref:M56 family metallopeptidase n=1 Tax=Silvibacterium sp. TaxID=1964179 RepID=UPI0039E4AEF3
MISPLESHAVAVAVESIAVESVVRSLAMAAVVWGAIRLFRLNNLPAQKLAWTLVLALSCAMPGLLLLESAHPGVLPSIRLAPVSRAASALGARYEQFAHRFHALRSVVEAASAAPQATAGAQPETRAEAESAISSAQPESSIPGGVYAATDAANANSATADEVPDVMLTVEPARPAAHPATRWHLAPLARYILPAYLAVSAVLLLRVLVGLALAARLWRKAERASALVYPHAALRISSSIESPVTVGSGIVLPASSLTWNRSRLHMVLAHERAHVRQGDFYLQLAASLYAALTWISPLGWFLKRQLAELGEAASDRAALDEVEAATTTDYAELLLELASMPRRGFARAAAGVGMARPSSVQSRIERILNPVTFAASFTGGRISGLAAALLVPCALLVAVSGRRVHAAEIPQQITTVPQPAIAVAPEPASSPLLPAEPEPAAAVSATAQPAAQAAAATSVTAQPAPAAAPRPAVTATPAARPVAAPTVHVTTLSNAVTGLSEKLNSVVALSVQPSPVTNLALALSGQSSSSTSSSTSTGVGSSSSTGSSSSPSGSQSVSNSESHTYSVDSDIDDEEHDHNHNGHRSASVLMLNGPNNSFAIVQGDGKVHGEGAEGSAFEKARAQTQGDMMWFERDGKSYVITDPATIDAGLRLWKTSLSGLAYNYGYDRDSYKIFAPDLNAQLVKLKAANIYVRGPQISQEEIQKEIAEAQKNLAKIQAEFPAGKDGVLTPEQSAEIRREVEEAVRTLTKLEADGTLSRQIRIQVDDQVRKQIADNRATMERSLEQAREATRQAREEARKQSVQQMQSFFDQALHDGKARPVQ